jgi:hypothetical protein
MDELVWIAGWSLLRGEDIIDILSILIEYSIKIEFLTRDTDHFFHLLLWTFVFFLHLVFAYSYSAHF